MTDIPTFVTDELMALGMEVAPDALALLGRYLDHLLDVNQQFNLTSIRDRDGAWRRHIIDSLTLLPALADLPEGAKVIDVGSGGGLPGIPLAITRPDWSVTLLEATGKKARFLEQTAALLELSQVQVVADRAESAGQALAHRQRYDAAVCRAVGPLRELLEYCLPLVKVGGLVAAMKGPKVAEELPDAGDALDVLGGGEVQLVEAYPESFDQDTLIVLVRKERPTPRTYPRSPGTPRLKPL